ncbi:hypothetical protein, partial [Enterococcus faecium]
ARLLADELDDPHGAIETLRQLVAETGPAGPGYAPLAKLYEKTAEWGPLVDLLEGYADTLHGSERLTTLERAVALADDKGVD